MKATTTLIEAAVESIMRSGITSDHYNNKEAQRIITSLKNTRIQFNLDLSLWEIWLQEKEYYIQHGMSAFDCGIAGLKIN